MQRKFPKILKILSLKKKKKHFLANLKNYENLDNRKNLSICLHQLLFTNCLYLKIDITFFFVIRLKDFE